MDARRLLVRQVDVALLGLSLLPHHLNFVARLHLRLAFVIEHFRKRQHSFRLGADVNHDVRRSKLQHSAFDDAIFSHGLFGFRGEVLKRGCEVFACMLVVGGGCRTRRFLGGRSCSGRSDGCNRNRSLILLTQVLLSQALIGQAVLVKLCSVKVCSELCSGKLCSVEVGWAAVGSVSVATAVAESEWWVVVSSNKVMPLVYASHFGAGRIRALLGGLLV